MHVKIDFKTDNAAFEEDLHGELTQLFVQARTYVNTGREEAPLRDSNGNTVGRVVIKR